MKIYSLAVLKALSAKLKCEQGDGLSLKEFEKDLSLPLPSF